MGQCHFRARTLNRQLALRRLDFTCSPCASMPKNDKEALWNKSSATTGLDLNDACVALLIYEDGLYAVTRNEHPRDEALVPL